MWYSHSLSGVEREKKQEQLKAELEKAKEAATRNKSALDVEELSNQIALKMQESRVRSRSRGRQDSRSTPMLPAEPMSQDRVVPTSNTTNLFVSNLNYNLTEKNLYDHFRRFGYITSVKVLVDANGLSKGRGFVCFRDANDAKDAITGMNLTVVQSRTMYVKLAEDKGRTDPADHHVQTSVVPDMQKSGYATKNTASDARHQLEKVPMSQDCVVPKSNTTTLFVSNLNYNLTGGNLYDHFRRYGYITSVEVLVNANGSSKGCGFVCFRDANDAKDAISGMNLTALQSRTMYVKLAEDKSRTDTAEHHMQTSVASDMQTSGYTTKNTTSDVRHQVEKVMETEERVSKGYGFVSFRRAEDGLRAQIAMNSQILGAKLIYVNEAQKKEARKTEFPKKFEKSSRYSGF